jgi:endonuclease-3 related protein
MGKRVEEGSGIDTARLRELARLLSPLAPRGRWWPYDDPFEVAVSAVLTQRARWEGAQRALENLRGAKLLSPRALARAPRRTVEACVRTAGFYRQKAAALQAMGARVADGYGGRMEDLFALPTPELRRELLSWRGVGDETADAILLFAAGRPVFVVDAYTVRLMERFGATSPRKAPPSYPAASAAWSAAGAGTVQGARALHAAIVEHGKATCSRTPACERCPLQSRCAWGSSAPRHGRQAPSQSAPGPRL